VGACRSIAVRLGIVAFGLLSISGYAADLRAAVEADVHWMTWYVMLVAGQFALYLAASWLILAWAARDRVVLVLVLAFGLLFRLAVVPQGLAAQRLQLLSDPQLGPSVRGSAFPRRSSTCCRSTRRVRCSPISSGWCFATRKR